MPNFWLGESRSGALSPYHSWINTRGVSEGRFMDPEYGPEPPLKGSDVWAFNLCRVYKVFIRGALFRAHTKGP